MVLSTSIDLIDFNPAVDFLCLECLVSLGLVLAHAMAGGDAAAGETPAAGAVVRLHIFLVFGRGGRTQFLRVVSLIPLAVSPNDNPFDPLPTEAENRGRTTLEELCAFVGALAFGLIG